MIESTQHPPTHRIETPPARGAALQRGWLVLALAIALLILASEPSPADVPRLHQRIRATQMVPVRPSPPQRQLLWVLSRPGTSPTPSLSRGDEVTVAEVRTLPVLLGEDVWARVARGGRSLGWVYLGTKDHAQNFESAEP